MPAYANIKEERPTLPSIHTLNLPLLKRNANNEVCFSLLDFELFLTSFISFRVMNVMFLRRQRPRLHREALLQSRPHLPCPIRPNSALYHAPSKMRPPSSSRRPCPNPPHPHPTTLPMGRWAAACLSWARKCATFAPVAGLSQEAPVYTLIASRCQKIGTLRLLAIDAPPSSLCLPTRHNCILANVLSSTIPGFLHYTTNINCITIHHNVY